jgi:predicted acetyltransferase
MPKTAVVIVFLILLQTVTSTAYAQSAIEPQQQCAKEGSELINSIGNPFSYNAHYSKKLNGCFARAAFYEKQNDGIVKGTTYLYNVSDGKIIGFLSFIGSQSSECWVEKTKCKSVDEFDDLIAPYIDL